MRTSIALALLFACAGSAYGAPVPVSVLPTDGCPTQAAVDAQLARLLPNAPATAFGMESIVADQGSRFVVLVFGVQRAFVDPARDCAERARTAAVTLAVAMAPPTVTFAEPPGSAAAPPPFAPASNTPVVAAVPPTPPTAGPAAPIAAAPPAWPTPAAAPGLPEAAVAKSAPKQRGWHGFVLALGATCPNMAYAADDCVAVVRIGYELKYAEPHLGFIGAPPPNNWRTDSDSPVPNGNSSEVRSMNSTRVGVQMGIDLGTPYFRLSHWDNGGGIALAARAGFDLDFIFTHTVQTTLTGLTYTDTEGPNYTFTNTYGPNLAVDLSRHVRLYARAAVGWGINLIYETSGTLAFDAFAGLNALF